VRQYRRCGRGGARVVPQQTPRVATERLSGVADMALVAAVFADEKIPRKQAERMVQRFYRPEGEAGELLADHGATIVPTGARWHAARQRNRNRACCWSAPCAAGNWIHSRRARERIADRPGISPSPSRRPVSAAASACRCAGLGARAARVPIGVRWPRSPGLYGLSFREPMRPGKLWVNLIASTVLASVLAPLATLLATRWLGPATAASAVTVGLAGAIGFCTQYLHRWLRTRRDRLLDGAVDRVLVRAEDRNRSAPKEDA